MASELPADWRDRMVDMIRGARPLEPQWFTGGPVCTPADQIEIYLDQYRMRLYDALVTEVIGTSHLLGDRAEEVLRRYLADNPSHAWTLNRIADALAGWLATQPDVPPEVAEMARLDWAVQHGWESAEGDPLDPARLMAMPPLVLQPHVHLVRVTTNVHEIRSALLTRAEPPALRRGDFPLIVFRRGYDMRHWCAPLGLWGILDGIGRGLPVPAAIDQAFVRGMVTAEQLEAEIGGWFRDLAERRLVSVR
ncbi:MAG: putative DNA-binding domain-containing protein [Myxococcota bacterium]